MNDTATLGNAGKIEQALAALDRRAWTEAEALLDAALASAPDDADALQLLGLLRKEQGRIEEAETLYRRSLAANANQPHVHHNLGNLYYVAGCFEEAVTEQQEAVRQRPNYVEAWLNLGHALSSLNRYAEAEKAYRRALYIRPGYAFAVQSLGAVLNSQGKFKEGEAVLREALAARHDNPRQVAALEHNLGVSLKMQRRYGEALALFDSAQAKAPDMPQADFNRANVLQRIGRLEEAIFCYRRAIARNPIDLAAHRELNQLLYRLERNDEFLRSYDDAAVMYPELGFLPLAKANFRFLAGDYENSREDYARAAALLPDDVQPHDGLALIAARSGDFDTAIREHEIVVRLEPQNAQGWVNFAETFIRAGEAVRGEEAARKALAIAPTNQHALAMLGLSLRAQGRDDEEHDLNDYERFVEVIELAPPAGYADMASFNRDLNAFLDNLHNGKREFLDQSLRGGTQTLDNLFGSGIDLVERLRQRVDEAVAAYIARMKDDENHPLLKRRRKTFDYAGSWSSRLHDCGYHSNHVHQKGWISSAYYIAVPDAAKDENQQQGWLKFGEPAFDAGFKQPVRRAIQPVPGRLVLFPSYMWHGTVPFQSRQARTTIAFDAVPR